MAVFSDRAIPLVVGHDEDDVGLFRSGCEERAASGEQEEGEAFHGWGGRV
jgi:hypothetical protein